MTEFDHAEFWEGLGRLYTETVALREATQALARVAEAHSDRLDRVEIIIENGMQSHEKRMQRIDASHERVSSDLETLKQRQEEEREHLKALRERQEKETEHVKALRERQEEEREHMRALREQQEGELKQLKELREIAQAHEKRLGGIN